MRLRFSSVGRILGTLAASVCDASLVTCEMILSMMIVVRLALKAGGVAAVRRSAKEKSNPKVPIQRL